MTRFIVSALIIGRTGAVLLARALGNAGTPITRASIASMSLQVRDLDYSQVSYGPAALVVATCVFDSCVQNDQRWIQEGGDATGYNVLVLIPALALSMPGKRVRADVKFVPVAGENFVIPAEANLVPVYIP